LCDKVWACPEYEHARKGVQTLTKRVCRGKGVRPNNRLVSIL